MRLTKVVFLVVALMSVTATARTVVTVNGTNVDERELFSIIQKITRGQFTNLPEDKKELAKKVALEQSIASILIKQEAEKSDIKQTKEYKKAFVEYVKNVVEPELSYRMWMEREMKKVKVTDQEIKKYYADNKDRFNQPKKLQVHHILSKEEEESKSLLALISKAKDKKAAFLKVASEKMGPGSFGGESNLGVLDKNSPMAPAFKAAYLKMKANSISKKPVKTQFGYHIIYVDKVQGGKAKTFEELKPTIQQVVQGEKFDKILKVKVKALHKKATINFK